MEGARFDSLIWIRRKWEELSAQNEMGIPCHMIQSWACLCKLCNTRSPMVHWATVNHGCPDAFVPYASWESKIWNKKFKLQALHSLWMLLSVSDLICAQRTGHILIMLFKFLVFESREKVEDSQLGWFSSLSHTKSCFWIMIMKFQHILPFYRSSCGNNKCQHCRKLQKQVVLYPQHLWFE